MAEPEHRFYPYCEGTKTEPAYFQAVSRRFRNAQVLIKPIGVGGVARTVAKQAIAYAKELRSGKRGRGSGMSSYEEADQVWAVFDRNGHPQFREAVARRKENHVLVAQSDPCFELWLVLHSLHYYGMPDAHNSKGARQGTEAGREPVRRPRFSSIAHGRWPICDRAHAQSIRDWRDDLRPAVADIVHQAAHFRDLVGAGMRWSHQRPRCRVQVQQMDWRRTCA